VILFEFKFRTSLVKLLALNYADPCAWFVPEILQCYAVAPILFYLLKKYDIRIFCVIQITLFIALNFILFNAGLKPINCTGYRGLFFANILLFGAGLAIAQILSTKPRLLSRYATYLTALIFCFFIHITIPFALKCFYGYPEIAIGFLFLLSSILFVYTALNSRIYIPMPRFFQALGIYSYSIYLFHRIYFRGLEKIGLLEKSDTPLSGILACILLLPVFLAIVTFFEEIVNSVTSQCFNLKNIFQKESL
jgi:peptidoglycan/LPS O-acetylase OafA/YrhL